MSPSVQESTNGMNERISDFVEDAERQAEWRNGKAQEYPDDRRNRESATAISALISWVEANPDSPLVTRLGGALVRLYGGNSDSCLSFQPSVTDRLGRMAFDYTTDPEDFMEGLAEDIEEFLNDHPEVAEQDATTVP